MMRIGGFRRKTRHKLSKNIRKKGKVSLTQFFQKLQQGDKVLLKAEPAIQTGMYFPRFHGKTGTVVGKIGKCYQVLIQDKNKQKLQTIHPVHLRKWQN